MKRNRLYSLLIILLTYVMAFFVAYLLYPIIPIESIIYRFFVLDIIATFVVFLVGLIFKNASVYDPYWSVAPMVIIVCFAKVLNAFDFWSCIIICIIFVWGIRLTLNWLYTFKNLNVQDWRYDELKENHPKLWLIINLFGIHMFPTIIVFIGLLPAMYVISLNETFIPSVATILAITLVIFAITIETFADVQMHIFRKQHYNNGLVNDQGLWKNSRHPNYFGEILFWFSLYLIASSLDVSNTTFYLIFCPLLIFLMFAFISAPMMEKRQLKSKPAYLEYKKRTNMFLPIFPPKNKDGE